MRRCIFPSFKTDACRCVVGILPCWRQNTTNFGKRFADRLAFFENFSSLIYGRKLFGSLGVLMDKVLYFMFVCHNVFFFL